MKKLTLSLLLYAALQPAAFGWTPQELWQAWPEERFVATPAPCLRHRELTERLEALEARHPGRLRREAVGRSYQGRPIYLLTVGRGPRKVLLWSQMHGDEPSATPALLDIADFLLTRAGEPAAAAILDGLTLLMVPMLNPDGAEIYERRNAQGIDVNRDALNLATPEGRLLKRLRDEHAPILGFNLHDQNRRTSVGSTGVPATNALLAVAGDPAGTLTPGRRRAKRACAAVVEALAALVPGGMARYDEDWSPRAFGDNLTAWGTPVVLIESGGLPPGRDFTELSRLNFVAILRALEELVRDDLAAYDPQIYDRLPRNTEDAWVDVAVRGGTVWQPLAAPYRADLAFNVLRDEREAAGCAGQDPVRSRVFEIGDCRFLAAGRELAAEGSLLLVPFVAGVRGFSARRWLDAQTLADLARLGVGSVRWAVAPRRAAAAERLAREWAGEARARIEVAARQAPRPWLEMSGPPAAPASDSLADVLAALGRQRGREEFEGRPPREVLERLWGGDHPVRPPLRPRQPASFLLVSPAVGGQLDLDAARLVAVFIDGIEARMANDG